MRIGVYNQFWSTLGGGEQYAGSIAEALAHRYDVSLLTPSSGGLDADLLFDRLSVDLRGLPIRELTPEAFPVSAASLDYDVFINVSFQSGAFNLAPTGVYVAHFPSEGFTLRQRAGAVARALRLGAADPSLRSLGGLKRAKGRRRGWVVEGQALLQVTSARPTELGIALDAGTSASTRLRIVAGRTIVDERLIDGDATVDVTLPAAVALSVFLIADTQGEGQGLHVPLLIERIALDGQPIDPLKATLRQRLAPLPPRAFLDSYDQIVANSGFTREWIGRRWGRDASVLHPPVRMRAGGDKEQLIVSVGRFFAEHAGHSKKQLEMVRAFRHLVERGLSGWRLVLIGGCSAEHRDYAMAVKREAIGLPVEVRLNAPGEVLDDALARASIYWHAAGLGVDPERDPDDVEHFGIAPIEAMSAGAVPIVYGVGGPGDVVDHGVSGLHFRTLDELVDRTSALIADPARLAALRRGAIERSHDFSLDHFRTATVELVERVAATAPVRRSPRATAAVGTRLESRVISRLERRSDPRRAMWGAARARVTGAVRCNICGWRGDRFEGEPHSESAVCPSCGSIARDRFLYHCYVERNPFHPDLRVLETSPRLGPAYKQFMAGWCRYFTSDFDQSAHSGALCVDLQQLGLRAGSIDVVLTPHVLEHVPDTDMAIAELHRVVASGGVVYLQVPVQQPDTGPPPEPEYHSDNTFVYWRFGFDLTERLRKAGFETVLLTTEDFVRRARLHEPWGAGTGFPDDLLQGVVLEDLVVVADDAEAAYRGFEPSFWFLTWECRRP